MTPNMTDTTTSGGTAGKGTQWFSASLQGLLQQCSP